ncbi:MAG: S16 family serine protease [Candidatus Aenigmatarchaeota archaeon]
MYRYKRRISGSYKSEISNKKLIFLAVLISFSIFYIYYLFISCKTNIVYYNQNLSEPLILYEPYLPFNYSNLSFSSITVPAIDEEGNGMTVTFNVQLVPGNGRILVNIDKILFWTDTQNSIRIATKVASNITGKNLTDYDIIYTIITNATSVEGPSAGAALTLLTIGVLENKKINEKIFITGTINPDGSIGQVSEILKKAKVAKEAGAEVLLVPPFQSKEIKYETKRYCEKFGIAEICTIESLPIKINISDEVGIKVIEVSNIKDAMRYIFSEENL